MKPESARALWIFAMILIVIASIVSNPSGIFFLSVAAALLALPPALLGTGRARLGGALACVLSLMLAVASFPAMQKDLATYTESAKRKNTVTSVPAPGWPVERAPSNTGNVK